MVEKAGERYSVTEHLDGKLIKFCWLRYEEVLRWCGRIWVAKLAPQIGNYPGWSACQTRKKAAESGKESEQFLAASDHLWTMCN